MNFYMKKSKRATTEQLNLPFCLDEDSIRDYLQKATGKRISLTITDNISTMLAVKRKGNTVLVRLQRIFLEAGRDILDEITEFIENRKNRMPFFSRFMEQNKSNIKKRSPRKIKIRTRGEHHNLREIYENINKKYFGSRISCPITWGIRNSRRVVRNRTLGSYDIQAKMIRISPVLDRKRVPKYFLAYIVYHEMLHADLKIEDRDGKRPMHSKEFRKREKLFEDYKMAINWEKKYL